MLDSQLWIRRHWRRLLWGQYLGVVADYLAFGLVIAGCWVLLMKLFLPALWPVGLWSLLGLLVVPGLAWRKVWTIGFTETEAVALLDRKLNAGGLLMTLSEAPNETWQEHLPRLEKLWQSSLPRLRPRRFASLVAPPLAFAIAASCVPLRESSSVLATTRPVVQKTTEELESILKTLEEENVLTEQEQEALRQEIRKFAEETHEQAFTHEQWEAADSLKQQMQMAWEKNERALQAAGQAAEELLSALNRDGELSPEQQQQLEQALNDALKSLADKGLQGKLGEMAREQNFNLSERLRNAQNQQEREQMLQELRDKLKEEFERIEQKRKECEGLCEGGNCQGGNCFGDGECEGNGQPGSGGISRGGGAAPMIWGKESDAANSKFKEVLLPPGMEDQASDQILSVTIHEPEENVAESAPRQQLRDVDPTAGRVTWERSLNPRHRDVVRKFFQSERKEQAIPSDDAL